MEMPRIGRFFMILLATLICVAMLFAPLVAQIFWPMIEEPYLP